MIVFKWFCKLKRTKMQAEAERWVEKEIGTDNEPKEWIIPR